MADIFISYASNDLGRVHPLAEALSAEGFSVWWDKDLKGGARFSKVIEQEINNASSVIVVWSEASIESQWVADEAEIARDSGKLVPVSIDGTMPPIGFRQIQVLDLESWKGNGQEPSFKPFCLPCARATTRPFLRTRQHLRVRAMKSQKGWTSSRGWQAIPQLWSQ